MSTNIECLLTKTIYAFDRTGKAVFGFEHSNYRGFSPNLEIQYGAHENSPKSKSYSRYEESHTLHVKTEMFALLKDRHAIKVEEVVVPGQLYRGHDVKHPERELVDVLHTDIISITEVLGKNEANYFE